MYLVVIAWLYVTMMMAVAEASSPQGTFLGAVMTLLLYGLLPAALVAYVMGAPGRNRAIKARERAAWEAARDASSGSAPDAGGHPPGAAEDGAVAPVRKEP